MFYEYVLSTLRGAGIATIELRGQPDRAEWETLLRLVVQATGPEPDPVRAGRLLNVIESRGLARLAHGRDHAFDEIALHTVTCLLEFIDASRQLRFACPRRPG